MRQAKNGSGAPSAEGARARLLHEGLGLMAEGGAPAVSVSATAKRAGVSRRTAYNHFPNRAALLRAVRAHVEAQLLAATRREGSTDAYLLVAEAAAENDAFLRSQIFEALDQGARKHKTVRAVIERFEGLEREGRLRDGTDATMAATITFGSWLGAILAVSLARTKREKAEIARRFASELERYMRHGVFAPERRPARGGMR